MSSITSATNEEIKISSKTQRKSVRLKLLNLEVRFLKGRQETLILLLFILPILNFIF